MDKDLRKKLSSGKPLSVELKTGIIIQHARVEYMSKNIILFILKSGDYKIVDPGHVKKVKEH